MTNKSGYTQGFETTRMIIRKLTKRDIPVWVEFFLDKTPYKFIGLKDDRSPCEHSAEWVERQFRRYREGEYGLMALIEKDSMQLIGQCGLITMNVKNRGELELGYHIIKRFRGKGYATEAASAFRDYAFSNELAESLITIINKENLRSVNVSEKIGFNPDGETVCMNMPSLVYRMNRPEWDKLTNL